MTHERYQELLGRLLEDELSPADAIEFVESLRKHPELQRDLRQHLLLWEAWSQHVAAERSAESFMAAWRTRVRAEAGAREFSESVLGRIRRPDAGFRQRAPFWRRWTRPWQIAFAVFAFAFMSLASWWVYHQTANRGPGAVIAGPGQSVTIVGEGVCQWCVLGVTNKPGPAIRVVRGGATNTIFLDFSGYSQARHHQYFAGGTTVTAKGILRQEGARQVLKTDSIEVNGVRLP